MTSGMNGESRCVCLVVVVRSLVVKVIVKSCGHFQKLNSRILSVNFMARLYGN